MLRIYPTAISLVADAARAAAAISKRDRDLARQLRRAAASVPLNIAEGSGVSGGNRRQRYLTALGSAREVQACFDVAVVLGYVGPIGADVAARFDAVIGTLVKVSR